MNPRGSYSSSILDSNGSSFVFQKSSASPRYPRFAILLALWLVTLRSPKYRSHLGITEPPPIAMYMVNIGLSINMEKLSFAQLMLVSADSSRDRKGRFKSSNGGPDSEWLMLFLVALWGSRYLISGFVRKPNTCNDIGAISII